MPPSGYQIFYLDFLVSSTKTISSADNIHQANIHQANSSRSSLVSSSITKAKRN